MVTLGALVAFEGDVCKVTRNSKLLAIGEMCGNLYILKVIQSDEEVNVAKEDLIIQSNLLHLSMTFEVYVYLFYQKQGRSVRKVYGVCKLRSKHHWKKSQSPTLR